MTDSEAFDIAIIGGGIIGSSVAYFLLQASPGLRVCVIEPDPTYEFASTLRASGGARRLFSCPENIEMSNYSIDFIEHFEEHMSVDGDAAHVGWRQGGYLFIAPPQWMNILERNAATQLALGVDVVILDRAELSRRYPSMFVDDLGGAVLSPRDGWCDPHGLLQGFRRKARALGARYLEDRVAGLGADSHAVTEARLASGSRVRAESFVNAAGAWAGEIAQMAGMTLPIHPLRRFEHYFTGHKRAEPLPYVKDFERLAFRPEGAGFSGGLVDSNEPRGFNFDVDHSYFDNVVWPALAHRFPDVFEGCKCHRTWSGLYEQCELDGNPIIGRWERGLANFHVVAGFSGHGMMHAPAAGRAMAELILTGRFQTIDLARFGYARVETNTPYPEQGII